MKNPFLLLTAVVFAAIPGHAQFTGFINKGLVAVGKIPAGTFDKAGQGTNDTLGGFSAMAIDPASVRNEAGKISGTLYGLPDRGFGDGSTDYHPRIEVFRFTLAPYYGTEPVGPHQIQLTNVQTLLLTSATGENFTGYDAGNTNELSVPRSSPNSPGRGRLALDPEGLVRLPNGSWWISDEYGPALAHFNTAGQLLKSILPPPALLPKRGPYPGQVNFSAAAMPTSGRRNNRGFEGLTLTPDGRRLVAFLQSPTVQDQGDGNGGRNTRVLEFDASPSSPGFGQLAAEYIYQLTLNGSPDKSRHTPVSEVLALDSETFLALERDSLGRGALTNTAPIYKKIVLFSTRGATSIAGTAYDLEGGAPGQQSLPASSLPESIVPVQRMDFVDLLDPVQLGKFGITSSNNPDTDARSIPEKWEALSLLPLRDPEFPRDYLLLVGSDNDFKAPRVVHNGVVIGTNTVTVDIMLFAFRVTLPIAPAEAGLRN